MTDEPPLQSPWNLGIKVKDLDAELAYLKTCGATGIEVFQDGDRRYAMAFLGKQRLLLFPKVIYEEALAEPLKFGLAHAVYEVADVQPMLQRMASQGIKPVWGPRDGDTPFGRRRMIFFRSPSGFVFEIYQTLS